MLHSVIVVCWEALVCPFTTASIIISCWIWMKFFTEEWDSRNFSYNYNDVFVKNQWWRILVAPLSHSAIYHLLLNVTVLWGCRLVELNLGTFFVFRYSIVLAVSEALLSLLLIHFTIKWAPMGPLLEPILTNTNSFGSSGVIMAWLSYQSFAIAHYVIKKPFVLFGMVSFSQEYAMLVMTCIYYIVLPRQSLLSNLTGLLSGLFLYLGVLQIVPDLYWSVCFLFNVTLIMLASVVLNQNAVVSRSVTDEGGELVEVQSYGLNENPPPGAIVGNNNSTTESRGIVDIETGSLRESRSSDNLLSVGNNGTNQGLSGRFSHSSRSISGVGDSFE